MKFEVIGVFSIPKETVWQLVQQTPTLICGKKRGSGFATEETCRHTCTQVNVSSYASSHLVRDGVCGT